MVKIRYSFISARLANGILIACLHTPAILLQILLDVLSHKVRPPRPTCNKNPKQETPNSESYGFKNNFLQTFDLQNRLLLLIIMLRTNVLFLQNSFAIGSVVMWVLYT